MKNKQMCRIINNVGSSIDKVVPFAKDLYSHASKQIGFNRPPTIIFDSNLENAKNILGKTAHYEPSAYTITVYVDNRHPKDILRSISHELVHHAQNCRGEFDGGIKTAAGYAQEDGHMREMEREAYEKGNMCFRDWEDRRKKQLNETIYRRHKGDVTMSLKNWRNNELNSLVMEKFGYKPKVDLQEDLGHDFVDTATTAEKTLPEEEKPVVESDDDEEQVVEEDHPMSADQRLKTLDNLDETQLRSLIREKVLAALQKG